MADASPVPVLLYNVTMYTGVNLPPDAVATLSEHPNIVGIKESDSDIVQIAEHCTRTPAGFAVLAGSASTFFASMTLGAAGAVLAIAGIVPELCVTLVDAVRDGRYDEARGLQRRIAPLARMVGGTWGVPGLKLALDLAGFRARRGPRASAPGTTGRRGPPARGAEQAGRARRIARRLNSSRTVAARRVGHRGSRAPNSRARLRGT